MSVGTAASDAGQAAVLRREVLAHRIVAVQAGGITRDHQPLAAVTRPPTASRIDSEMARLSTGHLALMLMTSALSSDRRVDALGDGRQARQQAAIHPADDDGQQPAVRRDADDADAVVHAPADGAGHLGAVRITAAAGGAVRIEAAALRARRLVRIHAQHDVAREVLVRWRRCRNRAPRRCAAANVRRPRSPSRSWRDPTVRPCRDRSETWCAPRAASSRDSRPRSPIRLRCEVVRKSGPSQSGSAYSICGASSICAQSLRRRCGVEIRDHEIAGVVRCCARSRCARATRRAALPIAARRGKQDESRAARPRCPARRRQSLRGDGEKVPAQRAQAARRSKRIARQRIAGRRRPRRAHAPPPPASRRRRADAGHARQRDVTQRAPLPPEAAAARAVQLARASNGLSHCCR